MNDLAAVGLQLPTLLLPNADVDLHRWAVVACDQYTAQPAYWAQVAAHVGDAPSTLRLMLPEVYLGVLDEAQRILAIQDNMRSYLASGILVPQKPGWVLVNRQTARGQSRKGLVVALDLEHYDYNAAAQTLMRPTEGTILERLPPRVRVRAGALLELPHVMVLIDDAQRTVIEPLFDVPLEKLYDTPLMCDSGHVSGWRVDQPALIAQVAQRLAALADPQAFAARYGVVDAPVLLYAIGDGNHSVATAKMIWENLKRTANPSAHHPARYVLAELVNIHDEGLAFEAIHRLVFNVDPGHVIHALVAFYTAHGANVIVDDKFSHTAARNFVDQPHDLSHDTHQIAFISTDRSGVITIQSPQHVLPVADLQDFLDAYLRTRPEASIDYVHGHAVLEQRGHAAGTIGFYLPALRKEDFFRTVIRDGALPRKTFSMGEADEKRFYLECRQIVA